MNGIEIEEGIPQPTGQRSRTSKYPYDMLKPGQSFFISGMKAKSFASSVSARNKAGDKRYKVATAERNGIEGVRIWRVK